MRIGCAGLDGAGAGVARKLLEAHPLTVWDASASAVESLVAEGASSASSAADLGRRCDVVFLFLPGGSDAPVVGPGGLAEGLSDGALVIDGTIGSPAATRATAARLAERGVSLLDAPVLDEGTGAKLGTLAVMASGLHGVYERALPVLTAITPTVIRCGTRVGDGQAMALVNAMLSAGCCVATLEIAAMARRTGLSLETVVDVCNKGSGRNYTTAALLPQVVEGTGAATRFPMASVLDSLNGAIELGFECGAPTTITSVARSLLQLGVNAPGEKNRLADLIAFIESQAKATIAPARAAS